jgi:hypothetical protein
MKPIPILRQRSVLDGRCDSFTHTPEEPKMSAAATIGA